MALDPDLSLVVGLGLVLLSSLSIVAAWIDLRPPVVGGVILAVGLALVVLGVLLSPHGYRIGDLPMVIFTVLGRYVF